MYTILEIHANYKDNKLIELAVLWQSNREFNWVRASYSTTQPMGGYKFIQPGDVMNEELIQRVAGAGMNLPDNLKKKYFPGKRNWER